MATHSFTESGDWLGSSKWRALVSADTLLECGVLATLAEQPFGPFLLGLVAVGLVAYGAYMLIAARYRRMVLS